MPTTKKTPAKKAKKSTATTKKPARKKPVKSTAKKKSSAKKTSLKKTASATSTTKPHDMHEDLEVENVDASPAADVAIESDWKLVDKQRTEYVKLHPSLSPLQRRMVLSSIGLAAVLSVMLLVHTFRSFPTPHTLPAASAGADIQIFEALGRISEVMLLPDGHAKVTEISSNTELARVQTFFTQAQMKDFLILYPDAVLLYRPSIDKLVGVGPVR